MTSQTNKQTNAGPSRGVQRPSLEPTLQTYINDEITRAVTKQIAAFRQQWDTEIEGIIAQLMREVMKDMVKSTVQEYCAPLLRDMKSEAVNAAAAVAQTVAESHADSRALTVRSVAADLVVRQGKKIAESVRAEILAEINEKVVPKVDNLMKYVKFNTEDPMESINDYRFDVMMRGPDAKTNLLENKVTGEAPSRDRSGVKLSPYVGTVWGENY